MISKNVVMNLDNKTKITLVGSNGFFLIELIIELKMFLGHDSLVWSKV